MASAKIILHIRKKGEKSGYIKLRVTEHRDNRYYPTTHKKNADDPDSISAELELNRKFTKAEYERIVNTPKGAKLSETEKEYQRAFISFQTKADNIINELPAFSYTAFENLYLKNRGASDSILFAYNQKIKELKENEQIGTATNYQCAINSLNEYKEKLKIKQDLKFIDITPDFLKSYDKEMRKAKEGYNEKTKKTETKPGKSATTISMYLRTLRTILNEAIAEGLLDKSLYPFRRHIKEKKKYAPPAPTNVKKALDPDILAKLYYYEAPLRAMQQAKDFWVLSYLLNGMNMKDILNLRVSNMQGDLITYERIKTANTKETPTTIKASVKADAMAIIRKYRIPSIKPDAYLFPFLNDTMDAEMKHSRVQSFVHNMNKNLKKICKELGIPSITTYSARHTFATILKNSGVSAEFISEALGHSDLKTTKNYLDSFGEKAIHQTTDVLIPKRAINE